MQYENDKADSIFILRVELSATMLSLLVVREGERQAFDKSGVELIFCALGLLGDCGDTCMCWIKLFIGFVSRY